MKNIKLSKVQAYFPVAHFRSLKLESKRVIEFSPLCSGTELGGVRGVCTLVLLKILKANHEGCDLGVKRVCMRNQR